MPAKYRRPSRRYSHPNARSTLGKYQGRAGFVPS
jgi:hypothetical protein